QDYSSKSYDVSYKAVAIEQTNEHGQKETVYQPITKAHPLKEGETPVTKSLQIASSDELEIGQKVSAHLEAGKYRKLDQDQKQRLKADFKRLDKEPNIVHGTVKNVKENEVEITV